MEVEVEFLYRADSKLAAAILSCRVSRGTFPFISWLFNSSALPSETDLDSLPHYVLADRRRTLVLTELGPGDSGYYCCRVRDSYEPAGPWLESAAVPVRVTGANTEPGVREMWSLVKGAGSTARDKPGTSRQLDPMSPQFGPSVPLRAET